MEDVLNGAVRLNDLRGLNGFHTWHSQVPDDAKIDLVSSLDFLHIAAIDDLRFALLGEDGGQ